MSTRHAALILAASTALTTAGCTRLSPATVADFGAEKTVLVTLRDGETIKGHLDEGEEVTFVTFGRVYRAKVETLGDNGDITLARPYLQEEYERVGIQRQRMEGSILHIRDDTERISIPAYKIAKVEEISFDRMKSARAAGFWGFALFVTARILGARL